MSFTDYRPRGVWKKTGGCGFICINILIFINLKKTLNKVQALVVKNMTKKRLTINSTQFLSYFGMEEQEIGLIFVYCHSLQKKTNIKHR